MQDLREIILGMQYRLGHAITKLCMEYVSRTWAGTQYERIKAQSG
jgi:hypothetical protein